MAILERRSIMEEVMEVMMMATTMIILMTSTMGMKEMMVDFLGGGFS